MDQTLFFIIVAIVLAVVVLSAVFSNKAIIKRKLRKAEFREIANFKNGEIAKIVGRVVLFQQPLVPPLSFRKCAYYHVHVKQRISSGKNTHWKTIIKEDVASKFLVQSGQHFALIDDENVVSYITQDASYSSGFLNDASESLEGYLRSKGYESEGFLGINKSLRYTEGVLEPGEEIAVFGKGKWVDSSSMGLSLKSPHILLISSFENTPVYLSDDPNTTIKKARKIHKKERYNRDENNYRR